MIPPNIQKEVVQLSKDGLTPKQIRQRLHLTAGQVAGLIFRARQRNKLNPPPFCCSNCGTCVFPGSHVVHGDGCEACKPLIYQKAS